MRWWRREREDEQVTAMVLPDPEAVRARLATQRSLAETRARWDTIAPLGDRLRAAREDDTLAEEMAALFRGVTQ